MNEDYVEKRTVQEAYVDKTENRKDRMDRKKSASKLKMKQKIAIKYIRITEKIEEKHWKNTLRGSVEIELHYANNNNKITNGDERHAMAEWGGDCFSKKRNNFNALFPTRFSTSYMSTNIIAERTERTNEKAGEKKTSRETLGFSAKRKCCTGN